MGREVWRDFEQVAQDTEMDGVFDVFAKYVNNLEGAEEEGRIMDVWDEFTAEVRGIVAEKIKST